MESGELTWNRYEQLLLADIKNGFYIEVFGNVGKGTLVLRVLGYVR